MPGPVSLHHVAIVTTKFDESLKFYRDVLGLGLVHQWKGGDRRLCLLAVGNARIELIEKLTPPDGAGQAAEPPIAHLTFRVDDVDTWTETVRAYGCEITTEPKDVVLGDAPARLSFFVGPNGETLEFFSSKAV
ncbi:MAG TPA: VOC family protein [Candidatus Latescibacteria bacterium]|nr:VOC family protein [Candidatus Latescibacterota bacterium]HQI76451.1 VOC family protein [Candidatus Latescibacterota bacterium]HQK21673.1 VOC family protein [Candidatus Latescibacterota bacterium]HRS94615.1 VOC family protein [Candidatus Latescibacterota bacterium]